MSFEKIIGYENVKEELSRLLDVLNNKEKYAKLGVKQPQGLLIYGEQGIGKTLFATNFETDEYYFYDKTFMENRVMTLLGGKAATELVYGATDVGCNNDLHRAFDIVTRFVDNYCSFDFSSFGHAGSSNELRERIDDRVAQEMQKYYLEAKNILTNNREYLDGIAELLLEKKILTQKDIREVANRCKKSLPKDYYVKRSK